MHRAYVYHPVNYLVSNLQNAIEVDDMLLERVRALAASRKEDERQLAVQMIANYGRVGLTTARSPCTATSSGANNGGNATTFLNALVSLASNERGALLTRVSAVSSITRLADVKLDHVRHIST